MPPLIGTAWQRSFVACKFVACVESEDVYGAVLRASLKCTVENSIGSKIIFQRKEWIAEANPWQAAEAFSAPMRTASLLHDRFVTAMARGYQNKD